MPEEDHFRMKAEAGKYEISGAKIDVPTVFISRGFAANTAAIVGQAFSNPFVTTIIEPAETDEEQRPQEDAILPESELKEAPPRKSPQPNNEVADRAKPARTRKPPNVVTPAFYLTFLTVTLITIVAFGLDLYYAGQWPTPTPRQIETLNNIGFAWKMGFGAIVGLLGGKQV